MTGLSRAPFPIRVSMAARMKRNRPYQLHNQRHTGIEQLLLWANV
jgi:hypothetical protein